MEINWSRPNLFVSEQSIAGSANRSTAAVYNADQYTRRDGPGGLIARGDRRERSFQKRIFNQKEFVPERVIKRISRSKGKERR